MRAHARVLGMCACLYFLRPLAPAPATATANTNLDIRLILICLPPTHRAARAAEPQQTEASDLLRDSGHGSCHSRSEFIDF